MLLDGLIAQVSGDATVLAIFGGDTPRVYRNNKLPRGYVLPAIVAHRYGGTQDYDYKGAVGVREDQVQFDCYAAAPFNTTDPDIAQKLGEAIRGALKDFVGTLPDGTEVTACYVERYMDMPYRPDADTTGTTNRTLVGFTVVSNEPRGA